jgi:tetratricopeptide (TPR) repeat protein
MTPDNTPENPGRNNDVAGRSAGAGGLPNAATPPGGFQSTDPTRPNYRPDLLENTAAARERGGRTLAAESRDTLQAGRKVSELKSLAAGPAGPMTPFEELMKQGEAQMKAGKYLEAGDAYQLAVASQPNNALAILGRGNAELAAGMYESAATDLQFVFTKKPELISVKYALGDYIPVERQGTLIADLTNLAQGKATGNMSSFLLCYLCYQTGRKQELNAELDRWAARPWKNEWQVVAEKAWR